MCSRQRKRILGVESSSRTREPTHGMNLGNRRVIPTCHHSNRIKRDLLHHLLVYLHRDIKVSILTKIRRTSELDQHSLKKVSQRDSLAPAYAKCGISHPGKCRDGQRGCFMCGQEGHFMRECHKKRQGSGNPGNRAQSSSVASPRGATSGTGEGENLLYLCNHQPQKVFLILSPPFHTNS